MYVSVELTYRDEKKEFFKCTDYPSTGSGYLTLYLNLKRIMIPCEAIKRIEYDVKR